MFTEVDAIRREPPDRSPFRGRDTLRILAERIGGSPEPSRRPVVRAFLEDIGSFAPGGRLDAVRGHVNGRRDNHLFSLFGASCFPKLSLDCLTREELPADPHLAECYAVEGVPRPDYDAVASPLLFGHLGEHGGIRVGDGVIEPGAAAPTALAESLCGIQRIEAGLHREPVEAARRRLLEFTNRYTDYDPAARDYRYVPFPAEVKERLGV
ncbi:hypothetical protein [Streptomyces sp. KL2]|uniref:hypothetical protein n=1 Tax=Streptomyces sp. KL2 TaxID=3050126 RepID=UPI00397A145C